MTVLLEAMSRYSQTRGIMYSAPPGPEEDDVDEPAVEPEAAAGKPTAADDYRD